MGLLHRKRAKAVRFPPTMRLTGPDLVCHENRARFCLENNLILFDFSVAAITVTALNFNTMYFNMDASTSIWIAYLVLLIITEVILEVLKIKSRF